MVMDFFQLRFQPQRHNFFGELPMIKGMITNAHSIAFSLSLEPQIQVELSETIPAEKVERATPVLSDAEFQKKLADLKI